MIKDTIKTVSDFLEYMDFKYPWDKRDIRQSFMRKEEEFKFFVSLIRKIIESTSEISDEDKLYVRRFFDILVSKYWDELQEQKYPPKPKYSAEHAFDVIRTLNCSLEDKLKIAELFEYSE